MTLKVSMVTIGVKNQQKALEFYTKKLGFIVVTDEPFSEKMRWIELAMPNAETKVVLFTMDGQEDRIGTMSNVIFSSDDVQKTYEELVSKDVEFTQIPQKQPWGGTIAIFKDVDGNTFCIGSKD